MRSSSTSTSPFHPANLPAALGIGLLKASTWLPLRWTQAIGKALGTLAYLIYPYRRHVARVNLQICFPEWSEAQRQQLLRRHYQAMGMGIFEMAAAWWKTDEAFGQPASIKGLEHLEAVKASGRGALLLTAHFTTLEIVGRFLLVRFPFSCLYRKPNQPYIAKVMTAARNAHMRRVIHFDRMDELIRALREGEFIWYAPDQGKRIKYSAILPFFGEPAITNTATGRIARMGKAAILPFFGYRDAKGGYHVEILPEITGLPTKDPEADGITINRMLEGFIRKAPDQYFWLHKRFKARGEGYPDAYARGTNSTS
jgi:KDO2-lipid IV(A) lauroyltransferase